MAETDILNPIKGYDPRYKDSMNPNQGWQRTRKSTLAFVKPAFGRTWGREVGNTGHIYTLNYTRRNILVSQRLKQFFEQFENGFFTLIDHDWNRHYVGRFVGDMPQTFDINGRFSSTGWTFEEQPGCPMLQYPDNWEQWAVIQRPFDDYGDQYTATSGVNWAQPAAVANEDGVLIQPRQIQNLAPTAGDYATHEYRGYGFRLWALTGPEYGIVNVIIDGGAPIVVDLYNADEMGPTIIYQTAEMPLDYHRVQVVLTATKNAASTGTGIVWDKIEVMR